MAGPETYSVNTQRQQAAVAPQGQSLIRSTGAATRPATAAQQGSISYVGAQVAEESAASQYSRAQSDKTTDWLLKAASAIIEPKMQALQSQQVMKGIQEAAAGKSIDEIKDAPPWYSAIFGDSDLVTAARAYQAQAAVSKFVTQVQRDIPTMNNMSPEEARNYMTTKWQEFQTGDMITDAVANQQFLNAAPGLFEQYNKQNYKNWQETAKVAQQQAYSAMSASYNQKAMSYATDGTISKDDLLKSQVELINGLSSVDGQTFESWSSNLVSAVQDAVNNGNFHSVTAITSSGLLDNLPPDQQSAIGSMIRAGEAKSIMDVRITPEYSSQIADLQWELRTGQLSPQDVFQRTAVINASAKAKYGYTMPLIGPDEVESWMGTSIGLMSNETNQSRTQAISDQKRLAQKTADEAARQDAERRELMLGGTRFSSGGLIPPGESTDPVKKAGAGMFDRMEQVNPGSGYTSLVNLYANNNGLVIPTLQARFQSGLQTSDKTEWTPEFDESTTKPFMQMIAQHGGHNAAVQYFGAGGYKKMTNYLSAMNNGVPQPLAYHEAFVEPQRLGDTANLTKEEQKLLRKALGMVWYKRNGRSDSATATIMQSAAGHYADLKANSRYTDDGERAETALNLALNDGNIASYGRWAWDRDKSAKPLHEQVGLSSDQTYGVLSTHLERMPQFKGTNLDNASFIERVDSDGNSALLVYVPTGDGKFRIGSVSAADIRETAKKIRDAEREHRIKVHMELNNPPMRRGTGEGLINTGGGTGLFSGGTGQR
ncbi:hypothetical protein phiKT_00021 [Escherichia phage phiKT]|uniref:Internal virion protein n=1 Tax=Escherichia phage phiKT TaxID=1141519 RepID=H6VUB6_BPPKT|nr:internal virion protein [Escherichia phage phiKT]AEZ65104.1 hypothetical protein phiKT_00021 [Escherichia phage phiKT]